MHNFQVKFPSPLQQNIEKLATNNEAWEEDYKNLEKEVTFLCWF